MWKPLLKVVTSTSGSTCAELVSPVSSSLGHFHGVSSRLVSTAFPEEPKTEANRTCGRLAVPSAAHVGALLAERSRLLTLIHEEPPASPHCSTVMLSSSVWGSDFYINAVF